MKKAFTVSEIVIAFAIVGILSAIMLSSLGGLQPDKEKIMFKKAYSLTERAVGELVNDENIYPYLHTNIGFRNTVAANVEGTAENYSGDEKFCKFFGRKLNITSNADYQTATSTCTFDTSDGMSWNIYGNFSPALNDVAIVMVDINGIEQPNQPSITPKEFLESGGSTGAVTLPDDRDRFFIVVHFDGRVTVAPDSLEAEFLRSHEARKTR